MSRKPPRKPSRRPATRPRNARGQFVSKRAAAAMRGHQTRRKKERAFVRAIVHRVKASKHGEAARRASEARLTPAQVERRRKDAARIARKARTPKKAQRAAPRRSSARLTSTPTSRITPTTRSTSKPQPSTAATTIRGDSFAAQIRVRFHKGGISPTTELVNEAIRYRIENGEDFPDVTTKILRWRNPGRRRGEDRAWRQGNQDDAWETLGAVIEASL